MNLSTVALVLIAWQLLKNNNRQDENNNSRNVGISDFLSEDTKSMLGCFGKLSSGQCSEEDRASAIFQIMSNPAVMNIASNLFGNFAKGNGATDTPPSQGQTQCDTDTHTNSEGYKFETPSTASQEFFRPIDNIADTEVKHKLYWFYDNWYVK